MSKLQYLRRVKHHEKCAKKFHTGEHFRHHFWMKRYPMERAEGNESYAKLELEKSQ